MASEDFPKLKEKQVVVARADYNTGIVLDEYFNYAINPDQKVYTLFDHIDEALIFAKAIVLEKENVECIIHGNNKQVLFLSNSRKCKHLLNSNY